MPAPLARGIIIATSFLIAAGVAVYENPQVRQWVDQSRRKVSNALHSLGDDVQPPSRHEDTEEERRRQREELMYWNMKRDEQRRERQQQQQQRQRQRQRQQASKTSFDEMVTREGNLKEEDETRSTATEVRETDTGLRRRNHGHNEAEQGAAQANPFADHNESHVLFDQSMVDVESEKSGQRSRSSTNTIPAEQDIQLPQPSPSTEAPSINQPQAPLVDLTHDGESPPSLHHEPSSYWSVNEWAESTSPSFYEASVGSDGYTAPPTPSIPHSSTAPSLAGSGEDVGADSSVDGGDGRYIDVLSEAGISTPGSWTEVGSEVSEGDHGT